MSATAVTDYHRMIRDAMKDILVEHVPGLTWHVVEDLDDAARLTLPCGVLACVGPEQDYPEYGTNLRDGIGYAVGVMLLGSGSARGANQTGPESLTGFRRVVRTSFHKQRLTALSQICECAVRDSGPLVERESPLFQKLSTALVVTAIGRFPRS